MRILWQSNHPCCPSGYGVVTANITSRLKQAGYDVQIFDFVDRSFGVTEWNGMPVYSNAGSDKWGVEWGPVLARELKCDLLLTLIDPWVLKGIDQVFPNWAAYTPIDHDPLSTNMTDALRGARSVIAMSRNGEGILADAGIKSLYAPHGVDTSVFKPRPDLAEIWREESGVGDRFLIGYVAQNSGRKNMRGTFNVFKRFLQDHPESMLYIHTHPQASGELNLVEMARRMGIEDNVLFPANILSNAYGMPPVAMAGMYSAFDVVLHMSMGEGFGIPIIEAQACGTPVIATDFTAMSELATHKIPVSEKFMSFHHSWWGVPDEDKAYGLLHRAYLDRHGRNPFVPDTCRNKALEYDWNRVFEKHWIPTMQAIENTGEHTGFSQSRTLPPMTPKVQKLMEFIPNRHGITIAEAGCMRTGMQDPRKLDDGWSTLYLASLKKEREAEFHSIDNDTGNIYVAATVLDYYGLKDDVHFICGRGHEAIKQIEKPIDFLYLDSSTDPIDTYEQFMNVNSFSPDAVVVVDDCVMAKGFTMGKGSAIWDSQPHYILRWKDKECWQWEHHLGDGYAFLVGRRIGLPMTKPDELYQDMRDNESRYKLLSPILEKFDRPFTVLDIGSNQGWFTRRIAKDFPESTVVSIEHTYRNLLEIGLKTDGYNNVIGIDRQLSQHDLIQLSECEHFDVVLALSVAHHLEGDFHDNISILKALGDHLILELANEDSACGTTVDAARTFDEGEVLGETESHLGGIRQVRWLSQPKQSLARPYIGAPVRENFKVNIFADFKGKTVDLPNKGENREWLAGINLQTYIKMGGFFPSRSGINAIINASVLKGQPHGDLASWNWILSGRAVVPIDFNDPYNTEFMPDEDRLAETKMLVSNG